MSSVEIDSETVDGIARSPEGTTAEPPSLFDFSLTDRGWASPSAVPGPATPSVAIVGLGYVGLPTALSLLEAGARVVGIDVSQTRLEAIRDRRVDLIDSDQRRLAKWLGLPGLTLTTDARLMSDVDVVIICVPTPIDTHDLPDPADLIAACAAVVEHARAGQTMVLTSTTFVGSTRELVVEPLRKRGLVPGRDVFVAFAPERIDPGNVSHPQESVPRVIGGYSPECAVRAAAAVGLVAPVELVSSPEVAELAKLFENTFRAVNIALANEFEAVSRKFGVNVMEVIRAAATKPFGFMPFFPGTGVGGHCIPCDPHYLLWQLREMHFDAPLIQQAMTSIGRRPADMVEWTITELADHGRGVRGARILVVGVAYKPGVQDVRESPALEIIETLTERGADVEYYDPLVPRIEVGRRPMNSVESPVGASYDAILVHALHPQVGYAWITECGVVLDPRGRIQPEAPLAREHPRTEHHLRLGNGIGRSDNLA